MKVTLVNPESRFLLNKRHIEPLNLMYIAGFLQKQDIETEIVDLNVNPNFELENIVSDVVGVTGTTAHYSEMQKISKMLKGKKLIAGGSHAQNEPQSLIDLGYEISGGTFSQIITAFTGKTISEDEDLKFIPPARDLINRENYTGPSTAVFSLGCPKSCGFCAKTKRRYVRFPVSDIISDLEKITGNGEDNVIFYDDFLTANKNWLYNLTEYLSTKNIKWRCSTRTDSISEKELALMKKSGLIEVAVGVESGSQIILNNISKGSTVEQNTMFREICKNLEVSFKAYMILGLPGETRETMQETYNWIEKNKPDSIGLYLFMPLPGSPIYEKPYLYDIKFPKIPFSNMIYAGDPRRMESIVSTSRLKEDEITSFYRKMIEDFKIYPNLMTSNPS